MVEPIVSREEIARIAEPAARALVLDRIAPRNPYPEGTAAHLAFEATLERFALCYSSACVDCEGSA